MFMKRRWRRKGSERGTVRTHIKLEVLYRWKVKGYIYIYIRKWKQFQKDEPDSLAPRENKE
jgi:hypothetical protein